MSKGRASAYRINSREVAIVIVAVTLAIISYFGFYARSREVLSLRPVLANIQAQRLDDAKEIAYLTALVKDLESQLAQEQDDYSTFVAALRQEMAALTKRKGVTDNAIKMPGKYAYLTFDDGPLAATARILDILKEHEVKATFFVNGRDNQYCLSMYRRMAAEGHTIGNHTYSHEYDKIYSSVSSFVAEVEQLQELILKATGVSPEVLRFPGGSDNRISFRYSGKDLMPTLVRVVQALGLTYYDWNVTSASASAHASKDSIYDHVIAGCHGKDVVNILFHETLAVAEALPDIIAELRSQGYELAPLTKESPAIRFLR